MQLKNSILGLGLVALLGGVGGCRDKNDVSQTVRKIDLTRPEGCEKVEDPEYDLGSTFGNGCYNYQVLCRDVAGNLSLYARCTTEDGWIRITMR